MLIIFITNIGFILSRFATSCVYYGLSLNVSKIGGDVFVNSLVMGVAGVAAVGVAIYILRWIGRRTLLASNFLLAGVFCVTISILPEGKISYKFNNYMYSFYYFFNASRSAAAVGLFIKAEVHSVRFICFYLFSSAHKNIQYTHSAFLFARKCLYLKL